MRRRAARRQLRRRRRHRAVNRRACSRWRRRRRTTRTSSRTTSTQIAAHAGARATPAAPLLDRATQGLFVPGSTFKVITAAAALDTGRYTPGERFDDPGYCIEYGKRVSNFADQGRPEVFGNVDLTEAVENSINSVFCNIGKDARASGDPRAGAKRFGFYERPPIELPSEESGDQRPLPQRAALSTRRIRTPGRPGPARLRPGAMLATPLCRWRWWPRASRTAAS